MDHVVLPKLTVANAKDEQRLAIISAISSDMGDFSVANICKAAGISRKTFYSCFTSKHDIGNWWSEFCEQFYLNEMGRTLDPLTAYRYHFALLYRGTEGYNPAYVRTYGKLPFGENVLARRRAGTLFDTLRNYRGVAVDTRMDFCVRTFAALEVALADTWAAHPEMTETEIAASIVDVMPAMLADALALPER